MILKKQQPGGYIVVGTLAYATIAVMLLTGLVSWAGVNYKAVKQTADRERAFQIAEAGIEYYRWHLAHSPLDYYDGQSTTTSPGPYVHPYYDKMGNQTGRFELTITPPPPGSTVVKIVSEGIVASSSVSRSIEAIMAIPSLAKYAFVANAVMRYGEETEVFGPIHGNDGIRFDGLAHNIVTSAKSSYDDPDHNGPAEFAVHTHRQVNSSAVSQGGLNDEQASAGVMPSRSDVFEAGRQLSVPAVDWGGLTQDLATLKTAAQSGGRYVASSGAQGYNIVLRTNGTFDLYKVTSLKSAPNSCYKPQWDNQGGWGTWTIRNQSFVRNYPIPANGVIFVEDNVWVEGQIDGARVTIASGRFPESESTNTSIVFNKDIRYTNYDGRDVIALIAQYNVNAGMESEDDLQIDAALIAKNGRVGRYYYNGSCHPYDERTKIRIYGMIASKERYGFAYTGSQTGGYSVREIEYDGNLLYGPPPSFPLVSDQYVTISWREI